MIKKLITMALAAGAMLGAWADYKTESKNGYTWIYEQEGEESFIVGIEEAPSGTLSFPAELGGKPVRNLDGFFMGEDCFSDVTEIVIPEGVTNIYDYAFVDWSGLENVSLPDSLVSCHIEKAFFGTPFLTCKTFPEFILSASGTKLWGVKEYEGEFNFLRTVDMVVPASVTDIADYALGRFYIIVTHSDTGYSGMAYVGAGNTRIVFAGARPRATDKAFAAEVYQWDAASEEYVSMYMETCWDAVYYQSGAEGWTWGEEWSGVKTYALEDKIEERYTVASNLKLGRVYAGEQYGNSQWMEYCIWDNVGIGLYGDEFALIPVTGTGTITPVIIGDVPSGYLDKPQVWSDQKMLDTFTPKGVPPSKWISDGDAMWYYEGAKAEWEWPKAIWPENKVVSNRRWIVVRAKEMKNVWSGIWSFRVGISGTSEISDPVVVVPGDSWQIEQNFAPADFIHGVTISGYDLFFPWDESQAFWADGYINSNRPRTQTFRIDNWKLMQSGNANALSFKVAVPSAGTLVVSSEDDDDAPAVKEAFAVKGNGIVSDIVTVKPTIQDMEEPMNFWKTSNASHIRRIKVSGQTTLTFTCQNDDEEDFEFNRMYFFPESEKSVAVEVGYIKREVMNYGADYWGRDYIQGYVKGSGVYKRGETATLKAVSGEGEEFDHWEVRLGNLTLSDAQKTSPTLSFTVTNAMCGEMEDEEQIFISAVWKPKSKITALPSIVGAGTVTGTGRYHEGTVVTLTATAADGCSFVKWSDGETASTRQVEVVATDIERVLYACFDAPNGIPDDGMTFGPYIAGDKAECDVGLVGYTAKGLPSGLKYDGKSGKVTGAAKQAGEYEVTFTKKDEDDVTVMFSIREEEVSVGCVGLSGGTFTAGVAGNANGIPLEIASETGVKSVAVAKLPTGMKYDAKKELITGAPTKPGNYAVTVTVTTKSGAKRTETIAISVAALPDNVVGVFNGFVKTSDGEENLGTFQLTTTDAGKLTAKVTAAAGSYSFGGTCWDKVEGDIYSATLVTKKGETLSLALDSAAGWATNQLTGTFAATAGQSPANPVVARKNAFGKTWYFDAAGNERDGWRLSYAENAKAAALTVTLNADGSTKIAGKLGTLSVSASSYADVTSLSEGVIIADFAPVVSVKEGKTTLKRVLSIGTNLWFDRSNDHPYIGSVYLQ